MGGKIEKSHGGTPANPRGSRRTEAGAEPRRAAGVPPCDFSILPPIVKKSPDICKKVGDISQIRAINQKNVAIFIIVPY